MSKRIKDPIYGYIEIADNIISDIVDTAGFQRLRNVIQTSYSPLYASALHNRFVHSLGVYHLGSIVSKTVMRQKDCLREISGIDRYLEVFELACLMHDLGHAPFSHTGEDFYLKNGERTFLHNDIVTLTGDQDLVKEIDSMNYKAAPHELMSVVVALKDYAHLFRDEKEKSFFARAILGYPYVLRKDPCTSFLNCIISFLNSPVIDVDKLDYLMRDAFNTGFDTTSIDHMRLLESIRLVDTGQGYQVAFDKSAISVIENAVYAHDAERKWIQNHPAVQYEAYLLRSAVEAITDKYRSIDLFSYEALTVNGVKIFDDHSVSLLCDADIIFLMKDLKIDVVNEYYNRQDRRHPLWKSEAEYKAIFGEGYSDKIFQVVEDALEGLSKYLSFVFKTQRINDDAKEACLKDIEDAERLKEEISKNRDKIEKTINEKRKHLKWLNVLKEFADRSEIDFDFVILKAAQFNSGFAKEDFAKIQIVFDSVDKTRYFGKVTNALKAEKSSRERFFYIFYKRSKKKMDIDLTRLAVELGKAAMEEVFDEDRSRDGLSYGIL